MLNDDCENGARLQTQSWLILSEGDEALREPELQTTLHHQQDEPQERRNGKKVQDSDPTISNMTSCSTT